MNRKLLSACLLAGLAFSSQQAFAADGTITFTGQIVATTCVINAGTSNFSVTLPTVSTGAFTANVAGATPFQIALTGCTGTGTSVHAYFEGPGVNVSGRLANTGSATGVEVQLLDNNTGSAQVINAAQGDGFQNSQSVSLQSGAATLNYVARYYSTAPAAGSVQSQVAYTIVYN
jgi:major type 1 subunit fimbrin (pilin)